MSLLRKLQSFNNQLKKGVEDCQHGMGLIKTSLTAQQSADTARSSILVIDCSVSMGDADYPPSRLQAAIDASAEFVLTLHRQSVNSSIAVICFDNRAQVVLPLTRIHSYQKIIRAIRSITVGGGTNIAAGLKQTAKILAKCPAKDALQIALLTDGHGGNAVPAATRIRQEHHAIIDVVGIGGDPECVNESLLRKVATTDPDGHNHYRFIADAPTLKRHYHQLATGLVWKGTD